MEIAKYQPWHFWGYFIVFGISVSNRWILGPLGGELDNKLNFNDEKIGLLMSYFYMAYTAGCLIFGALGDRVSRRKLFIASVIAEILTIWICSQCDFFGKDSAFKIMSLGRFLHGLANSVYGTCCYTVVSDMYNNKAQVTKMAGIFGTAPRLGTSFAYIAGAYIASMFDWRYVFYNYLVLNLLSLFIVWAVPEYQRGQGEREKFSVSQDPTKRDRSLKAILLDFGDVFSIPTFLVICLGFGFTQGAVETILTFLAEIFRRGMVFNGNIYPCASDIYLPGFQKIQDCSESLMKMSNLRQNLSLRLQDTSIVGGPYLSADSSSYIKNFDFIDQTDYCQVYYNNCTSGAISNLIGIITLVAGIIGTLAGMFLYKHFDQKTKSAGPIVGGAGLVLGSSCTLAAYVWKFGSMPFLMGLFGASSVLMCFNYGILGDMVNRVVVPEQRSLAHGSKNILARLIGSITPPYLAGLGIEKSQTDLFQDMVTGNSNKLFHAWDFQKLRYVAITDALMKSSMFGFIAGIFWYLAARFWATDEEKKDDQVRNS